MATRTYGAEYADPVLGEHTLDECDAVLEHISEMRNRLRMKDEYILPTMRWKTWGERADAWLDERLRASAAATARNQERTPSGQEDK